MEANRLAEYELQVAVIETMWEHSKETGFESVTSHALSIMLNRYTGLLFEYKKLQAEKDHEIRQQQAEIERLNKISSKTIYDLTVTQLKLNSALQTIEAYKPMEQELERLNRAYEVQREALTFVKDAFNSIIAEMALNEAQRIKEGDGEQG